MVKVIKSMTGFGRFEGTIENIGINIEIKTVNHRYFDFNCRSGRGYGFLDEKLKNHIQSKISRGKVDVSLNVTFLEEAPCVVDVNHSLAEGYVSALNDIKSKYSLSGEITAAMITRFPDVLTVRKTPADEEKIWGCVSQACDIALENLLSMRIVEGERLKNDILEKAHGILDMVSVIEEKSPETVIAYRERLEQKLRSMLENNSFDDQRILTETAIFADKVAIDEETVRLRSHFDQLEITLNEDNAIGRKLDFLLQEMNREINTIGSKATNSEIAHIVVDVKSELEKIREQIQNIE